MLQQGIRNQVVVILDLSLTADNFKTQWLRMCGAEVKMNKESLQLRRVFQNRMVFLNLSVHNNYDQANW